jgi:hypothetical protein
VILQDAVREGVLPSQWGERAGSVAAPAQAGFWEVGRVTGPTFIAIVTWYAGSELSWLSIAKAIQFRRSIPLTFTMATSHTGNYMMLLLAIVCIATRWWREVKKGSTWDNRQRQDMWTRGSF